jgi:hypothetical protein
MDDRQAWLLMDGWEGRTEQAVLVVGETPKRYRIKAVARTKLAGRCRWISAGETALVPKYAVRFSTVPA